MFVQWYVKLFFPVTITTEKLEILDDPDKNLLNKRSEIISQCRHKNKYRLKTLASKMPLHCNDFATSVERVVIKLKIVK